SLRMAWGESPLYAAPEPEAPIQPNLVQAGDDELVEIVIPVGSWNSVRPGTIVGAIAGETGLPGSVVGRIKILERVTFVAVAGEHVARIMTALKGVRIGGRAVYPRLAHDPGRR
ncbi:MAG: DbpA RNA binding domain-containing protein, partial [Planctomycetota bacterium]|nr:DbpA RNA binding domain-containing protein [Planctomycetota bacterium]